MYVAIEGGCDTFCEQITTNVVNGTFILIPNIYIILNYCSKINKKKEKQVFLQ